MTSRRDARISWALAVACGVAGLAMLVLASISMMPGSCGQASGCAGGRDATPLTGIAVGSGLMGIAWAAARKARALGRETQ